MKNKRRNFLIFFLLAIFTVTYLLGCAQVEAGTMEELSGTYQLTKYKYETYDDDGNVKTEQDYIEERGIEFYLVITGTELGYVAYKDNNTPLTVREVQMKYNYDYDNPTLISSFEYSTYENNGAKYNNLYEGWFLGFIKSQSSLNNTDNNYEGCSSKKVDSSYIKMELVSKETGLTEIEKNFSNFTLQIYGARDIKSFYYTDYTNTQDDNYGFLFEAIELEYSNEGRSEGTLNYYYKEKGGSLKTVENKSFTVTYDHDGLYPTTLNFSDGINDYSFFFLGNRLYRRIQIDAEIAIDIDFYGEDLTDGQVAEKLSQLNGQ